MAEPSAERAAEDPALTAAIRRQQERVQRDPASLAFAQLADLYRKAGRTGEAIALCREGLARFPHYTAARLILAKAHHAEGDFERALAELTAILELSPRDVQSHRLAAEIHRRCGRLDQALTHLDAAVALDPGDRESRSLLGLLRASGPGEASGLRRVLADDTFVTLAFGSLCLEQGLVDEAASVFTRLLRKDPEHPEARERLEQTLRARLRRRG
ncbi:MAG TPA: tetratricopeptide repeat protein [Methylomirabilota bacterium]|jgi:tetratricopeptide (TPR) repeat protein